MDSNKGESVASSGCLHSFWSMTSKPEAESDGSCLAARLIQTVPPMAVDTMEVA